MKVQALRPMHFPRALLFFGLPLLVMTAIFWGIFPLMDLMGIRLFISFAAGFGGSMLLLLLLSLRFYRKEGHLWSRGSFADRFRLHPLKATEWLWTILLIAFVTSTFRLLGFTYNQVAERISEPKFFIRMMEWDPNYFLEIRTDGNWLLFSAMLVIVLVIVFGQELWWRGYIFPRQEVTHGKTTWIIQGLLSGMFYLFIPWTLIQLLPAAFAIPFVAQRLRNTWPGILAHFTLYVPLLSALFSRI